MCVCVCARTAGALNEMSWGGGGGGGGEVQTVSGVRRERKRRVAAAVCQSYQWRWVKSGTEADENSGVTFGPAPRSRRHQGFYCHIFFVILKIMEQC